MEPFVGPLARQMVVGLPVERTVDPFVALLVLLRSLPQAVQVARAQSPVGLVVQVRVCWGLVPLKY